RLTGVVLPTGRSITYQYDRAGNRTAVTDDGSVTTYTPNELNEYIDIGGTPAVYDPAGNLTARTGPGGCGSYTYDARNRLIGVSSAGGNWTYEYDALGRKSAVVHDGQRTEYLVDPSGLGNVVGEYDGTGRLVAHYTYGFGLTSRVDAANLAA